MKTFCSAACAAVLALPPMAQGQENSQETSEPLADEIVVVGRSVTTGSSAVEVEREILVDTAQVLKEIPGANVNSNGLITGIAQYRGMYGDRVAVDIDQLGMTSGGPNAMDAPLSYASPMITEKLVVSRGIPSLSLAPESLGGHVNSTLSRGEFGASSFGLSGLLGSRYSDNGSLSTSVGRLTLSDERHRVSLLAEVDDGNDIDTPEGKIRTTALHRERYDASYAYRDGGLDLLFFAGRLDTRDTGTPALPMDIIYIETDMAGGQVDADLGNGVSIEGRLGWNDVGHGMNNFALREPPEPGQYRSNEAQGSGMQLSLAAVFGRRDTEWRIGLDGIAAAHDSVITNPNNAAFEVRNFTDVSRDLVGAFVEWRRQARPGDLELGLRFNRVEADAGEVGADGMPEMMAVNAAVLADAFNAADRRLGWNSLDAVFKVRRELGTDSEWTLELGSKSRAPSYQELYLWLPLQATGGLADGRTYIGSLDLDAERSNEIVLGITSDRKRFGFSPQFYFRQVDGYIQGTPTDNMAANMIATMMSGAPALEFSNIDARIWGLDAAWRYAISDRLLLDGIVSLVRGRRTDADDNLYRLSPYNASLGLTWSGADWQVQSELVAFADQDRVSAFNDEQATDGYALVNLAFDWRPVPALRVEARIHNLLDETYQDHVAGINRAGGSGIPVGERLYGASRTFSAGLIYTF